METYARQFGGGDHESDRALTKHTEHVLPEGAGPRHMAFIAIGGKVIKCPSLLTVLKGTYDRSRY